MHSFQVEKYLVVVLDCSLYQDHNQSTHIVPQYKQEQSPCPIMEPWEPIIVLADEITRHVNIIIILLSPSSLPLQLHKYKSYLEVIFSECTEEEKK